MLIKDAFYSVGNIWIKVYGPYSNDSENLSSSANFSTANPSCTDLLSISCDNEEQLMRQAALEVLKDVTSRIILLEDVAVFFAV